MEAKSVDVECFQKSLFRLSHYYPTPEPRTLLVYKHHSRGPIVCDRVGWGVKVGGREKVKTSILRCAFLDLIQPLLIYSNGFCYSESTKSSFSSLCHSVYSVDLSTDLACRHHISMFESRLAIIHRG
jgi:hypothetical protein